MKVAVTDDAQEGARAFLEKRDPDWKVALTDACVTSGARARCGV